MSAPPPMPPPPPQKEAPKAPTTRPATQADLEKTMGFELQKTSPLFRSGGIVLLAGAGLLALQHMLVLSTSLEFGLPYLQALFGGGGGPPQPSPDSILTLLARISAAMRLDLIGFGLLGVGCILVALGARGLQAKQRATGELRSVSGAATACGVAAGLCFIGWVALTVQVRLLLTGSPTGDWSSAVGNVFGAFGGNGGGGGGGGGGGSGASGLPAVAKFAADFTAAANLWIAASVLLLVGAVLLLLFARGLRKATGMRPRLGVLVGFGATAVVAIWFFIYAFTQVFASVTSTAAAGGGAGDVVGQVLPFLVVGLGGKLVILPLEGSLLFIVMMVAGKRVAAARPGRVYFSKAERREIAKRLKAGEQIALEPATAPSDIPMPLPGAAGAPAPADVVVTLPAPPAPPVKP